MKFLNKFKLLVVTFLLSNCTNIDLTYIDVVRESFNKSEIDNLKPFEDTGLSFVRISKGRNQAIFILESFKNGFSKWVGSSGEEIITYKGLIVQTTSLDFNIKFHNLKEIQEKLLEEDFRSYASIDNPAANYLVASFKNIKTSSVKKASECINHQVYFYQISLLEIKDTSTVQFCINKDGLEKYSKQKIHPRDEIISMEFFYQ